MKRLQEKIRKFTELHDGDKVIIINTCFYAGSDITHKNPSIEFVYPNGLGYECNGTNRLSYNRIMHRLMAKTIHDSNAHFKQALVYDYIKKLKLTTPHANKRCDAITIVGGMNQRTHEIPLVIGAGVDISKIKIRISFEKQFKDGTVTFHSVLLSLKNIEMHGEGNYAYIKISSHANDEGVVNEFIITQSVKAHPKNHSFNLISDSIPVKRLEDEIKLFPYHATCISEFNNKILFQNQNDILINDIV